jgi:curved DNA-binding protein CbpA
MEYEPKEGVDYIIDLYRVAGAEREATEQEIKRALNERTLEYHPDRLEGLAPEFREKGERVARLLNRARGILLDSEKRTEYDQILLSWEGPISTDGTPVLSASRWEEARFMGKTAEEIETMFTEEAEKIAALSGYSPARLAALEMLLRQAGDEAPEELRAMYEEALSQQDLALAMEEAERSKILGLPDIGNENYVAQLGYGDVIASRLQTARTKKETQLQSAALGGTATRLALLAGEPEISNLEITAEFAADSEPAKYYELHAARIQAIATERDAVIDKRLENFQPEYPEAELQTELKENVIIGVIGDGKQMWLDANLDVDADSAEFKQVPADVAGLAKQQEFKAIIERGYGVMLVRPPERIDIHDVLGVAVGKYFDKYKTSST